MRRLLGNICVAELDIDNDGMLSAAEFAKMAKIAQLGRQEL